MTHNYFELVKAQGKNGYFMREAIPADKARWAHKPHQFAFRVYTDYDRRNWFYGYVATDSVWCDSAEEALEWREAYWRQVEEEEAKDWED